MTTTATTESGYVIELGRIHTHENHGTLRAADQAFPPVIFPAATLADAYIKALAWIAGLGGPNDHVFVSITPNSPDRDTPAIHSSKGRIIDVAHAIGTWHHEENLDTPVELDLPNSSRHRQLRRIGLVLIGVVPTALLIPYGIHPTVDNLSAPIYAMMSAGMGSAVYVLATLNEIRERLARR